MARNLRLNVTVGSKTYGPDYPDNEVTDEVRKELSGLNVWEGQEDDAVEPPSSANPARTDYDAMRHDALQEEIRRRNAAGADLKVSGSKEELVARLKEHDAAGV